jgi:hypothetical protein
MPRAVTTVADGAAADLTRLLDASQALDADLLELLNEVSRPTSQRQAICLAYCRAAIEHGMSLRLLIDAGLHGTALALIRLHFETVVRAAWVQYGAKDDWLVKFSSPLPAGDLDEPQMGPPIPAMLDSIGQKVPQAAAELRRLYGTVKVMHSFVHGGVHLVVHALRGYPADELAAVLLNRNLLSMILANVIVVAAQDPRLAGAVGRLMIAHGSCMPPRATA